MASLARDGYYQKENPNVDLAPPTDELSGAYDGATHRNYWWIGAWARIIKRFQHNDRGHRHTLWKTGGPADGG